MRDVTLVEVHADGNHLVLTDASGQQYRLGIDDQLRAAVRNDAAWLARLQTGEAQTLSPREIQTRIRAGMSAQEIVHASGMSLEHIQRYEGPVLAEREHMAEEAQKVAVSRSAKGDTTLAESVDEGLAARGAEPITVWDSWRDDHGAWIVQAGFTAGGRARVAQWRYLPADAALEPIDDEARWLTSVPEPEPTPADTGVSERVYEVTGDAVVEQDSAVVHSDETGARTLADPQARTLDLLDALRGRRGRRQPVHDDDEMQPDLVDALLDEDDLPPPAHPPASRPQEATDAEILSLREAPSGRASAGKEAGEGPDRGAGADRAHAEATEPEPRRPRASKRATVPSWDDIMFGAKRD